MDERLFGRLIDAPLDANGERQAAALAERLACEGAMLVVASPRLRTQQTARAIATNAHAEVLTANDLDEIDFGRWSGHAFAELTSDPAWRAWNERRDVAMTPAGESIAGVQSRVARHLHRLLAAYPNRTLALVTHAEVIRSTLLWILQMPATAYSKLEISPASFTTLQWRNGDFTVCSVNERARA